MILNDAGVVECPIELTILKRGHLEELVIRIACVGGVWLSGHSFCYQLGGESYPCSSPGANHKTEAKAIQHEVERARAYANNLFTCRSDTATQSTAKAFLRAIDSWRSEPTQQELF